MSSIVQSIGQGYGVGRAMRQGRDRAELAQIASTGDLKGAKNRALGLGDLEMYSVFENMTDKERQRSLQNLKLIGNVGAMLASASDEDMPAAINYTLKMAEKYNFDPEMVVNNIPPGLQPEQYRNIGKMMQKSSTDWMALQEHNSLMAYRNAQINAMNRPTETQMKMDMFNSILGGGDVNTPPEPRNGLASQQQMPRLEYDNAFTEAIERESAANPDGSPQEWRDNALSELGPPPSAPPSRLSETSNDPYAHLAPTRQEMAAELFLGMETPSLRRKRTEADYLQKQDLQKREQAPEAVQGITSFNSNMEYMDQQIDETLRLLLGGSGKTQFNTQTGEYNTRAGEDVGLEDILKKFEEGGDVAAYHEFLKHRRRATLLPHTGIAGGAISWLGSNEQAAIRQKAGTLKANLALENIQQLTTPLTPMSDADIRMLAQKSGSVDANALSDEELVKNLLDLKKRLNEVRGRTNASFYQNYKNYIPGSLDPSLVKYMPDNVRTDMIRREIAELQAQGLSREEVKQIIEGKYY